MNPLRPLKFAATGNVTHCVSGGIAIVVLTPAGAASTVDIRENGAAGTVIMSLQAAANGDSVPSPAFRFEGQLHVTLAGAGASFTVLA